MRLLRDRRPGCPRTHTTPLTELLPPSTLTPDRAHTFDSALRPIADVTYVRLNTFPDGGVARLRVFSRIG